MSDVSLHAEPRETLTAAQYLAVYSNMVCSVTGVCNAANAFPLQIRQQIEQINSLEKQIAELEEEISLLLSQINMVITINLGVGEALVAVIIGEVNRFKTPGKLVALAGSDATVNQSIWRVL